MSTPQIPRRAALGGIGALGVSAAAAAVVGSATGCTDQPDRTRISSTTLEGSDASAAPELSALGPVEADAPADRMPVVPFSLGVVAGVHSSTAVVIWTRPDPRAVTTESLTWEVGSDRDFTSVIRTGTAAVSAETDHCVKVLVDHLEPGRSWWYRFRVDNAASGAAPGSLVSPVGRAVTLPDAADASDKNELRLIAASCQGWGSGYFTMWDWAADQDVDMVLHLGDYIYESMWGGVRSAEDQFGGVNLATYRAKYRFYRSDPALQRAHLAHPFAFTWDDHEFWNDVTGAAATTDPWRFDAAVRAWWEYQPVWPDGPFEQRPTRALRWGSVAEIEILDERSYRSGRIDVLGRRERNSDFVDPERTVLGREQFDWLMQQLKTAQRDDVRWKVLANSVPMLPDQTGRPGSYARSRTYDTWDGFPHERQTLLNKLHDARISDVVSVTGDRHVFLAGDVHLDPLDRHSPVVIREFLGSGVSSGVAALDPEPRWPVTWSKRLNGVSLVTLGHDSGRVDFVGCDSSNPASKPEVLVSFDL